MSPKSSTEILMNENPLFYYEKYMKESGIEEATLDELVLLQGLLEKKDIFEKALRKSKFDYDKLHLYMSEENIALWENRFQNSANKKYLISFLPNANKNFQIDQDVLRKICIDEIKSVTDLSLIKKALMDKELAPQGALIFEGIKNKARKIIASIRKEHGEKYDLPKTRAKTKR